MCLLKCGPPQPQLVIPYVKLSSYHKHPMAISWYHNINAGTTVPATSQISGTFQTSVTSQTSDTLKPQLPLKPPTSLKLQVHFKSLVLLKLSHTSQTSRIHQTLHTSQIIGASQTSHDDLISHTSWTLCTSELSETLVSRLRLGYSLTFLVQAACMLHLWWWTKSELAIVFTHFSLGLSSSTSIAFHPLRGNSRSWNCVFPLYFGVN